MRSCRIPNTPFLAHQIRQNRTDFSFVSQAAYPTHPHLSSLEVFVTTTSASGQEHITVGGLIVQCFLLNRIKKQLSVLHEIEARGTSSSTSPLFFVYECHSNTPFLVDTSAACSLSPLSTLSQHNLNKTGIDTLTSIGMGSIPVLGTITHQLDLGFSQLFEHSVFVTELDYGILGADFLSRYSLNVDISTKRLLRLPEIERCCVSQDDTLKEFSPSFPCLSKHTFMTELLQKFPEVFKPLKRSRVVKHSVVAKVETVTETPVWPRSRRLAPHKLAALRPEINRFISNGILAKSHSV